MKRSEINRFQREALDFFRKHQFSLPPWATWTPGEWKKAGPEASEIKARMLGWDITDFGSNKFEEKGVLIFTLRNGPADGSGEPYCEKVLVLRHDQVLPRHFHWTKVEDIINRAGGELIIKVWKSDPDEGLSDEPVKVLVDGGIWKEVEAGEGIRLLPGSSVTLPSGIYHSFHVRGDDVLIGEVSSINDDATDNRFFETIPRFARVEEDEEILYYLCNEYP